MHTWVAYFSDGHTVRFAASEVEGCHGALRGTNEAGEATVMVRNWALCVRSDVADTVVVTPAPERESPSDSEGFTGRPFA